MANTDSAGLTVLLLGASGVFGMRLAARLAREPGVALILAARDAGRLMATRDTHAPDASIRIVDRDSITAADVAGADLLVDASGPFQTSHSRVIDAAIAAGAGYIDLADGRAFVAAIGAHDGAARNAGVAVISGASSVPALSHAVVDQLTGRGTAAAWQQIDTIRVGIFPGNRAPRGRAVVAAILSWAGQPVRVWRGGRWCTVPGWGMTHRWAIAGVGKRWASVCDTPDQDLLVARHAPTRDAEFFAGLELGLLHLGLALCSMPVRLGWMSSLKRFAKPLHWLADRFKPLGSDVGAMEVRVTGTDAGGIAISACWTLRAMGNRGPYVPTLAAVALVRCWRDGKPPAPGARSAAGTLPLSAFDDDFAALEIETEISQTATALQNADPG